MGYVGKWKTGLKHFVAFRAGLFVFLSFLAEHAICLMATFLLHWYIAFAIIVIADILTILGALKLIREIHKDAKRIKSRQFAKPA